MTRARGRPPKDRTPPPPDGARPSSSSDYVAPTEELVRGMLDGESLHLTRYSAAAGQWHYCGSYPAEPLRALGLTEFTKIRGGGGKYRGRVRHLDGTYGRSLVFTLEGSPRPWDDPTAPAPAPSISSGSSSRDIPTWVEKIVFPILVAAGTAIADRLLKGPTADPIMLELVKKLASNAGGTDAVELHKLIAAAESRGEERGRELGELSVKAETAAEPRDASGGVMGAIERGLPKVVEVLHRKLDMDEANMARRVGVVNPPAEPATDDAGPSGGPVETPQETPADPLAAFLLSVPVVARKFLLSAAKNDEPPEVYAALVLSKLDELTYKRMPGLVSRPDFVDVFVSTWPAFGEYRDWVSELAVALRESLEAAENAGESPGGHPQAAS